MSSDNISVVYLKYLLFQMTQDIHTDFYSEFV